MKKFSRIEKNEIINNVINKFMREWEDEYFRHEIFVEYRLENGKIIEIETSDAVDYTDKNYYMRIDLHDPRKGHMTWRYDSEFAIGRYWIDEYSGDGDVTWKCDNTIKQYIKRGMNKIFNGMETEKD